jgi:uncharacterized damage-inducible protein DinB
MGDFPDFAAGVVAVLDVVPEAGWEPQIGRLVWMLDAARRRTWEQLEGIPAAAEQAILDWRAGPNANSVGTNLYHLADIEASWLFDEVLEQPLPAELASLFAYDVREEDGTLTHVPGQRLAQHLQRLALCRSHLHDAFHTMTLDDFRRLRHLALYSVTPEWVLYHLIQHEAEHRSQISASRRAAERDLALDS